MTLQGNNLFFRTSLIMLVAGSLLMGSTLAVADVEPASMSELRSERTVLLAKMKELNASQNRIATLKAERSAADDSSRLAQTKNRESRDNLEKRQKQDREYPGENTDKLREAEEQNKQAANTLKSAKENLALTESNIIAANAMASAQYVTFNPLLQSFESRLKALVETQAQSEVVKLQVTKVVEAKGRVSCGDDGMRLCKEKSRKEARKNATEQGSIIDFSAFTEVKNFQLSKEEILSEVHATLSNEEVLLSKIVDDSSALTEIRVTVEPVISLKLRQRIADSVRDDLLAKLGGRIDFSEVNDPSLDAAAATAQRRKEEQAQQDAKSVEAELEQQAGEARRQSAQRAAESKQEPSDKWKFIFFAGLNNNRYGAAFTGTFNNKTANSSYAETGFGLTATHKDGYFVAISGAQGNGKHDLYTPAVDQAFKRSSTGLMAGMPASGNPNTRYFLSVRTATAQMTTIGQSWTQDTFASTGLGGGMDFLFPVAVGTFGLNIEGGIKSAQWSDDSGYSASSVSAYGGSGRVSYSFAFSKWAGVNVDAGTHFYNYKFNAFTVKEKINAIGVSLFAKF